MSMRLHQKVFQPDLKRETASSENEAWEVIQAAYDPIDEAVIGFLPVLEVGKEEDSEKSC